jgi:hypothetical protein
MSKEETSVGVEKDEVSGPQSTQVSFIPAKVAGFTKESPAKDSVLYPYKGCILHKYWIKKTDDNTNLFKGGELRTLLKDKIAYKGNVIIRRIEVEVMFWASGYGLGIAIHSGEEVPTDYQDLLLMTNKQSWRPNAATVGQLAKYEIEVPESVSRQIQPANNNYPSLHMSIACEKKASFLLNMYFVYDCTRQYDRDELSF